VNVALVRTIGNGQWDEEEHPRDEHGKFAHSGGGIIQGLPGDIKIKDRLIEQALERGVWDIKAKKIEGKQSGRDRYELTITSKIPGGIQPFQKRPEKADVDYYNPKLAEIYTIDKGQQYLERTYARPLKGLSQEITPLPGDDIIYRGMRAEEYEKYLQTGEIVSSGAYNLVGQEGLTYWATDPATAVSYSNGFAPWPHKATFERPAYVVAAKKPKETRHVEGVGENEVGVARVITRDEIIGVWRGDVFWHSPGTQDIIPASYDLDETEYRAGSGSSASSNLVWQRIDEAQSALGADVSVNIKVDIDPALAASHAKMVITEARATAKELGFDPANISIGAEMSPDRDFVINGKAFKAAGLAYIHEGPLGGQIKLFPDSLTDPVVVQAVTAHEIQHQKFQHALNTYHVERKMAQDEPGPPPDPNGKYHWQKKGGQDAVFAPDDSLREPYASKYKGYTAMHEALFKHNFRAFAESDGVSEYSFEYWKGWKAGTVNSDIALHETIAEMARFKFMTKEFPDHMGERIISYREDPEKKPSKAEIDANAKLWRKLYNTVEKLY
jgi:hypothetical protein